MPLSTKELKNRWKALDGQNRLKRVIQALQEKKDPKPYLLGFDGVDELEAGLDLRGVDLRDKNLDGADLQRAQLKFADLRAVKLKDANLLKANLQYALLWMANLQGTNLADTNFKGALLEKANLQGADLSGANFEDSDLSGANLMRATIVRVNFDRACLGKVNFIKVEFYNSSLRGVDLINAKLNGAVCFDVDFEASSFWTADLTGAKVRSCKLDGAKLFTNKINSKTDFRGSNLESSFCDHQTKNHLKCNMRRMNWEDWYKKHSIIQWPARFFWWLSEYGTSEKNLFLFFILSASAFAMLYWTFPGVVLGLGEYDGNPITASLLLRSFYFSIVTMTTLGFGDIHASPNSNLGHVLLTLQVLLGYLLLGALVSRLAILFQSEGPTEIVDPDSLAELEAKQKGYDLRIEIRKVNEEARPEPGQGEARVGK